jgi:twinkle protein
VTKQNADAPPPPPEEGDNGFRVEGDLLPLLKRRINEDTCKHFGYRTGTYHGKPCQFAYYYDEMRKPIAAKLRFPDKSFSFIGEPKKAGFYGQWLCRDKGKMIVVTEGEIDCLTVAQVQGIKWPVVSVPNGASGAEKTFRKHLSFLEGFEKVVIMFDMDEPGMEAAKECAKVLSPGKAFIATLPLKDPNEMLLAGRQSEIIDAIWSAKAYRPDGVLSGKDLWNELSDTTVHTSYTYPFPALNEKTGGLRKRELVTITAGTGVGKSAFVREIAYDLIINHKLKVGMVMLEESPKRTMQGLCGIDMNKPIHTGVAYTQEELRFSFEKLTNDNRLHLYDGFGSLSGADLIDRLRYFAVGLQCDFLILDHLSIAVSGLELQDERKAIDILVTRLRSLVEETGVGIIMVSHLRRVDGNKGHENGVEVGLNHLRGSQAIAQLSDLVLSLERDQQGENPNESKVRVLKNRFSGITGIACTLEYDPDTGRLTQGVLNGTPF